MFFIALLKFVECILYSSILIIIGSILTNPTSIRHFIGAVSENEDAEKFKPTNTLLYRLGVFINILAIIYIAQFLFGIGTMMNNMPR